MKQETTAPAAPPTRYRPGKIWEESSNFGDYLRRMALAETEIPNRSTDDEKVGR